MSAAVSEPRLRRITLLLASAFTLFAMAAVAPALPAIEREFADLPDAALRVRMVLTLPALFVALSAPFSGYAIDRLGRRPVLIAALVAYVVSGTSAIWLSDLTAILISRAVLGVAIGMMLTALTTLIGDYYEGSARNRMAGLQQAVMVTGVALGTALAGFLAEAGWRLPFYLYFGALLVIPLVWVSITEMPRVGRDAPGAAAVAEPVPWRTVLLPVGLLYGLVWASMISTFVVPSQLAFLLIEKDVPDLGIAGIAIAVFNVCAASTAFSFRRLRERFSNYGLLAFGYCGLGAGLLMSASAPDGAFAMWQAGAGMVVAGLGFGLLVPVFNAWILALAPLHLRGRMVGGAMMCQFFGFFCSPFWSQPLAEAYSMTGAYVATGSIQLAAGVAFLVAARCVARN